MLSGIFRSDGVEYTNQKDFGPLKRPSARQIGGNLPGD